MPQPRKSDPQGRKQPSTIDGRILKQQKTAQKYIEEAQKKKKEKQIFEEEITRVKRPDEKQRITIQPEELAQALPTPWKYLPHTLAMHLSGGKWRPYKFLVILSHILTTLVARGNARIVVSLPPRHGKALEVHTPIPTPKGWTRIVDLKVGDIVFDAEGKPTRVTGVTPIWKDRPVFSVKTDTGGEIIADDQHEWNVRLERKRPRVTTVWETGKLAARTSPRNPMIYKHHGLTLPQAPLPIDPYTLGVWLGDGKSNDGRIYGAPDDLDIIGERIGRTYKVIPNRNSHSIGVKGLKVRLRNVDLLEEKRIPIRYLRSSREQRLALLQGLIDTDGYIANDGQVEFTSILECLAVDVKELVNSLGYKASVIIGDATLNGRIISKKYRVMFYMPDAAHLPRKKSKCVEPKRTPNHYITVTPAGTADTVCIETEAHTFLAGKEMVPTRNSNFISEWFPTWYLANWPQDPVMLCTYEATFAASWGRKVRNNIKQNQQILDCYLSDDAKASDYWLTTMGGGMITAGAGGAITGKGFKLGIIDDPHKNWEEAMSPTIRGKIHDWYDSTFYTRAEEGASIIILQTRWHQEDLVGFCLAKNEGYVEIRIPALAEEENDFLGRRQGEALVPDRFDEKALDSIRRNIGSQMWASLYQQRPAAEEGNIFKRADLRYYKVVPQVMQVMQSWDTGFKTTKGSAYSVCQTWGASPVGYILLDQFREMVEWPDLEKKVKQQYIKWHPSAVLIEDKASGQSLIQSVNRWTDIMIPIIPITPVLDKVLRARTVSPLVEAHRVWFPDSKIAPWIDDFVDNLVTFPNIKYLDEIDALSQMLNYWLNNSSTGAMLTTGSRIVRPAIEDFHFLKNFHRAWK